jgi:preprotein translocase subunit SecD
MKQLFPVEVPAFQNAETQAPGTLTRKRSLLPWILGTVALVLLVGGGVVVAAFLVYRDSAPLVWHLTLALDPATPDLAGKVDQTVRVIEMRLDALGVKYQVSPLSDGRIKVGLPSLPDPERYKAVIIDPGKLELVHVVSPPSPMVVQNYATKEEGIASLNNGGSIPSNRRVLPYTERDGPDSATAARWVVVESPAIVDGGDLRNASAAPSGSDKESYAIHFSLRPEGADKFGKWTGANQNHYLGVVLNDQVKSIAYIKGQISDQGEITGRFTRQQAEDLALTLKSGSLPVPVKLVAEDVTK